MHDALGFSVAEVANELGVPEGTVKSWLSRARSRLSQDWSEAARVRASTREVVVHDEGTDTDVARRRMADATNWAAHQPWMLTSADVRGRRNRLVARRPAIAFGTIVTAGALIGSLAGAGVFSTPAASKSSPTQTQALQSFPPSVQAAAPGPGGVVVGRLVEVGDRPRAQESASPAK